MKKENPPMKRDIREVESLPDKDLEEALKSIHQQYGNDFQAFLTDVKKTLKKRHTVPDNSEFCL